MISRTTCRAKDDCQTAWTTYPTPSGDLDLRADQPSETRDGRSTGPTDNRFRTQYKYDARGLLTQQVSPDNGTVRNTYTTGAEPAVGGGNTPTGLPLTSTDPRSKVTRYRYFSSGDLAQITEPSGLVTSFTYDAIGRKLTETTVSDSRPAGETVTITYDALNRTVSTTEPATTNVVTLRKHQQRTTTSYDADGNVVGTEVSDVLGGDEPRSMTFENDEHGRPVTVTDAEGSETAYTYDALGNRASMVDANGNHFDYAYTARSSMAEARLRDWDDDGGDDDYTVLQSYAYDMAGRVARHTDAMGRTIAYGYYGDDLVKSVTLEDFHDPDGSTRDIVVSANTYDGAGNLLEEKGNNGRLVTAYTYDSVGRTTSEVTDPDGLARRTTYTYDLAGNVQTVASGGAASNVPWPVNATPETVRYTYDDAGNAEQETVQGVTESRTTVYDYDQRGLVSSVTDPGGNRTDYAYDEIGRPLSTTAPEVLTETAASTPTTSRPTTWTGYDTFGAVTESVDALGNVNRTTYDRLGRTSTATAPDYLAPGAARAVTPVSATPTTPWATRWSPPTRAAPSPATPTTGRTGSPRRRCPSARTTNAASGRTRTPAPVSSCRSPTRRARGRRRPTTTWTGRSRARRSNASHSRGRSRPATPMTTRATSSGRPCPAAATAPSCTTGSDSWSGPPIRATWSATSATT